MSTVKNTQSSPARLMAPWWRDLQETKADGRVWLREVKKEIAPYTENLKHDETYRTAVQDLLGGELHVTKRARAELEAVLANNPLVYREHASILDTPRYIPVGGARPIDPSRMHNRVAMKVLFNEGTATPVTKAWYDGNKLYVQVYGEATMRTRMLTRPRDVEVAVPRPPGTGMYELHVIDENGVLLKRGDDFSGAPRP
jgi:hypothetical protein